METSLALDPERQKKAKEYARIQRRFSILDMLISGVYVVAWLVFGWSAALRDWLASLTSSPAVQVALFAAIFGAILGIIGLPLSYYTGFVLPHRYGQSVETLRQWIIDQLKGLPIGAVIGLAVLEIIYWVLRVSPEWWWLWAALFMLAFSVILATLAPVVLMPIFNKFVPLGEEHVDLVERLLRLAERAHTRIEGVYKFDMSRRTKSANAALTGLGATRRMILGDTLLNEFTPDEIETVMAHELGHQAHRDIPLIIAFNSVVTLVGFFLAGVGLRWGAGLFGFHGVADPAAMPLLALVLGIYGLVTMPLNNGFSRWRERLADEYALQVTGNGLAFASAMTRLANQNLSDVDPERWVEVMFYSHPALRKRIEMAETRRGQPPDGTSEL